jgi:3-hydroxyisobutyrate dehydrogenase-like beta-hydroxyacid dehydrogenase
VAALRRSSAASWVLDTWDRPRAVPWAEEDMRMVRAAASRAGVDVPVAEAVAAAIGDIAATGLLAGGGFARPGWSRPA